MTAVLFLAESHILVSTWPEHRSALIGILLCNDHMDSAVVADAVSTALCAPKSVRRRVKRIVVDD